MITNPVKSVRAQNILKGVNILLKYNPEGDFEVCREQIFFGDLTRKEIEVSKEDRVQLEELGWFIDEEYYEGEWTHYV